MKNKMKLSNDSEKSFLERLVFLFGVSFIVLFYSEYFFFNEGPVDDIHSKLQKPVSMLTGLLEMAVWYVLCVAPAILILWFTRASNIWGLFLVGGIAGYLIEGLIVPPLYQELPTSLLWTSLSWHPLVDVIFGLWIWQIFLRSRGFIFNVFVCLVMGCFWALWATWPVGFESDTTGQLVEFTHINQFIPFFFITTSIVFIGNILISFGTQKTFKPTRIDYYIFTLTTICFALLMWLQVSFLIILLPALLLFCYVPLHCMKDKYNDSETPILQLFKNKPPLLNQLSVWAMPLSASFTYWLLSTKSWHLEYWVLAWPIILSGFLLMIISQFKLYRRVFDPFKP